MFKELFVESIKIQTYSGYHDFSKDDIQEMISNPKDFAGADNLPKWLGQAIRGSWLNKKLITKDAVIQKITKGILNDLLSGSIKKLDFTRDKDKNIIGFKDIKVKDYV